MSRTSGLRPDVETSEEWGAPVLCFSVRGVEVAAQLEDTLLPGPLESAAEVKN